ncbi:MAG: M56 family metallopeptidase [Flavipsychrobacter sp.]|nr:M56 family metallopeptidase [Flavipsychrobacter sp.]
MNAQATLWVQSLGWALLHSLWQGLLIYCSLRLVLGIAAAATSRFRYHLSAAALLGSFGWFVSTCIAQYQRLAGINIQVTQSGSAGGPVHSYVLNTTATPADTTTQLAWLMGSIQPYFPALVMLYIGGIAFLLVRLGVNLAQVHRMKNRHIAPADPYWAKRMQQWADKLGIERQVRLFYTEKLQVPVTIGALKPVILLPVASLAQLPADQLEAILLHELAHIKRHDYLLNILQTLVETVLFFNPFTWLIARQLRNEREHCCDDIVLEHTTLPLSYAEALATLEASRQQQVLAMGAHGNRHQLLNRIKRIMEMKKKQTNYTQVGIASLVILALMVSVAVFSPSVAQTRNKASQSKSPKTTTTTVTQQKQGKGTTQVVTRSIVIDQNAKGSSDGVHPNDVGNEEHIKKLVEEAMADADLRTLSTTVNNAIARIDWDQVNNEVKIALDDVDLDNVKKDLKQARIELQNIDWEKISDDVDRALVVLDDPALKRQIKLELDHAANGKSSRAMAYSYSTGDEGDAGVKTFTFGEKSFDRMVEDMEADGLLDRSKGYKIKKEDGTLYINGKKQPSGVINKYHQYLDQMDKVQIKGNEHTINVHVED